MTHAFVQLLFCEFRPTFAALISHFLLTSLQLQRAGPAGAAGPCAARSAAEESRCVAAAASPRTASAREQWRKGGPATLSPALVNPLVIQATQLRGGVKEG